MVSAATNKEARPKPLLPAHKVGVLDIMEPQLWYGIWFCKTRGYLPGQYYSLCELIAPGRVCPKKYFQYLCTSIAQRLLLDKLLFRRLTYQSDNSGFQAFCF